MGARCAHVNPCLLDASNVTKYANIPDTVVEAHQCQNQAICSEVGNLHVDDKQVSDHRKVVSRSYYSDHHTFIS